MLDVLRVTGSMRPNFLILTPICVLLGAAVGWSELNAMPVGQLTLVLLGALCAHASVNLLNEHEDFSNGLDSITERTPFSGGSGTLQAHPQLADTARNAGLLTLTTTAAIGVYLLLTSGIGLAIVGGLGLLLVASYSTWIVRHPLICLVAPGLGFGPLMVMGTAYVVGGSYTEQAALVSLVPFFLVSGLLLLNQFPDREPDEQVGRRTLPIVLGRRRAGLVFISFLWASFVTIFAGLQAGWLPGQAALGLIPMLAAVPLAIGVWRYHDRTPRLVPYLGLNVAVVLSTPALLAAGLIWASMIA